LANPSETEMQNLISNAHIHALYTEQATGLKLKLVNSLFNGRFVICNNKMIEGTGLHSNAGLFIMNSAKEIIETINDVNQLSFTNDKLKERKALLDNFSNQKNANLLLQLIT
jgi:hypothetical protein